MPLVVEELKEMIRFLPQEGIHSLVPHINRCSRICSCVRRGRVQGRSRCPCGDTETSSTIQLAQQIMEAPQVQHIGQPDGQVRPQNRKRQRTDISDVGLQGVRCSVPRTALPSHSRHEHERILARDPDSRAASNHLQH